jgi:hypothetical protein
MSRSSGAGWAVAFFGLWCTTAVDAAEPAASPASLVQAQAAAAQKQDVDGFLAGLTSSSRQALNEAVARRAALAEAHRDLRAALDEKFGQGTPTLAAPPDDLRAALARLAAAEVVGQSKRPDGSVELRVRTSIKPPTGKVVVRDEVLVARQEKGAWKLVLGFTDGKLATQAIAAIRRVTERVRKGDFKDRVAAMVAADDASSGKEGGTP